MRIHGEDDDLIHVRADEHWELLPSESEGTVFVPPGIKISFDSRGEEWNFDLSHLPRGVWMFDKRPTSYPDNAVPYSEELLIESEVSLGEPEILG